MKEIQINDSKVVFYDDIKLLPMEQFNVLQVQLLQDGGIGSDILDYDNHESKIDAFLAGGKIQEAIQERENKRFNIWFLFEKMNTKSLSLACLLYSIDGREVKDFTDDGLRKASKELEDLGITMFEIEEILEELKKKLIPS